jgi:hypothetical protein
MYLFLILLLEEEDEKADSILVLTCLVHGVKRVIFQQNWSRIYEHITKQHESKHAVSNMNFNFDDMGISLHTCSYNILRGYVQSMTRVRREASAPIGFLYLRDLDRVKMTSFLTYFHDLLLQGARRCAVGSGTALQGSLFDSRYYHLNFSLT